MLAAFESSGLANGKDGEALSGGIAYKVVKVGSEVIPNSSHPISDYIWKWVVTGFLLVFIGASIAIGWAVLYPAKPALPPETLITVFTTIIAFLGGLLAPSPLQNKPGSG